MQTIHNPTVRLFGLPLIENSKGESFGGPSEFVQPQSTKEVPDWYLAELKKHRTWGKRLNGKNTIPHPGGAAGQLERRALDKRAGRKASEGVTVDDLKKQMDDLKKQLELRTKADAGAKATGGSKK